MTGLNGARPVSVDQISVTLTSGAVALKNGGKLDAPDVNTDATYAIEANGSSNPGGVARLSFVGPNREWRLFLDDGASGDPLGIYDATGAKYRALLNSAGGLSLSPAGTDATLPTSSTILDLQGVGVLRIPRITSAERDALTTVNGDLIFNTTTSTLQIKQGGAWANAS